MKLPVGSKIGILGGGQLGRMLALAAAELGFSCYVFCPEQNCPAAQVSAGHIAADYTDPEALARFAALVDVVTYEFENVPAEAVGLLNKSVPVRPGLTALTTAQDRLAEKTFLESIGVPLAGFRSVTNGDELDAGLDAFGGSGVLKTCRFGYDGKGQVMLRRASDRPNADRLLKTGQPLVLEAFVPFLCEISVIAARSVDGQVLAYEIGDNVHENHILKTSTLPSGLAESVKGQAADITSNILQALDYVGVIGVEFFVIEKAGTQSVLVNEIAPRVHNSGHWTQDAANTCQFEQHIRAICGWPLGDPTRHSPVMMENLIGDDMDRVMDMITDPRSKVHLYGKSEVRPGRKMGHVNWLKEP